MPYTVTRRRALAGLASTLLLPMAGRGHSAAAAPVPLFAHGVASGDPDQSSIVLWTRVTTAAPQLHVAWEIARDERFRQIVASGGQTTDSSRDFTVKVVVGELEPGARYYYRFSSAGTYSVVGRTRTLADGALARVGLAIASCSNYPFGYFNAYEAIALDSRVDFVLHLGDYLYEYGPDGYGAEAGQRLGRSHLPAHEIVTLQDYRQRHAQYKADPQSRGMHAAHPLLAVWDDHESTNNPWMGGAQNHQPDEEGAWQPRRSASLQAWYEWMPVRDPLEGADPAAYWRHFRFGDLASLVTLETRHSGRSQQVDYDEAALATMDAAAAGEFMTQQVAAPGRTMLSQAMETFAATALADSVRAGEPWRLIGNAIPMARTLSPRLSAGDLAYLSARLDAGNLARAERFARLGELEMPLYLDPWDGYPEARERFYTLGREAGASDLLVLTGDSHSFWRNALHDGSGRPMGLELGTSGISSPGDFLEFGAEGAALMDQRLADTNPEVEWTDGLHNGYLRLELTPELARADFIAVSTIAARNYTLNRLSRVDISRHNGTLTWTAPPA